MGSPHALPVCCAQSSFFPSISVGQGLKRLGSGPEDLAKLENGPASIAGAVGAQLSSMWTELGFSEKPCDKSAMHSHLEQGESSKIGNEIGCVKFHADKQLTR